MTDKDLEHRFAELKAEDRRSAPPFQGMLDEARRAAEGSREDREGARPGGGRGAPWRWQALPLGTALAAAGIGAIAFFGGPSPSEATFREAVEWAGANPLFTTVGVPSDALLEPPEWALWKTGSPSGGVSSDLSELLNLQGSINNERNNS